jgi:hypothetical protein
MFDDDELIPSVLESDNSSKERRNNWARLIQKIYEVDPPTCPKCSGKMKVISVIEDQEVKARFPYTPPHLKQVFITERSRSARQTSS